jgi:multidrug efflux pump subunit AcrA (membrane-fusion protein)
MNGTVMKPVETAQPGTSVAEAAARSGGKLRHVVIIATVLVLVAAVVGLVPRWRQRVELRRETRELAVQTVAVASAEPGKAAAGLTLPAEVKPLLDAPIYARSSGYLIKWFVDIGGQVKEGDLLAEIDAPELRQELVRSKAELAPERSRSGLWRRYAERWAELLKTASVSDQEAAEKKADFRT